ncbi:MAG: cytochrome c-type biosis protein CcmH [Acidobacteriota bacterium]|jgi:cytochrome c-type biogenesis protein CcmH|nr:cytochrome c-type biosis protein CcmH [Acidobacteriota bacterium]
MKRAFMLLALLLCLLPSPVLTKEAQSLSDDPVLEKRVMALAENLRCLVCQNETLAGSHADLAVDLRQQIREQMKAGKSDQEIIAFMTERYGDFVLFKPPVKMTTYLLWFGPFALLAAGVVVQFIYLKRRRERVRDQPLSESERKRVEALLGDG